MDTKYSYMLLFLLLVFSLQCFADPTDGFTEGLDYSSGVWQFEGYGFMPNGTSGATISQIHGAASGATTLILRIYDGNLRYYSRDLVATDLYDKWFRLNVIHDVDGGKVRVFVNGVEKYSTKDKGPGDLYFKCGVYATPANISYYMESRWRDIKIYNKTKCKT
ncbi:Concanavalin A-like lectin/glucanases superfamily [Corchorus olitorius]|uniref:Concanavalin A-like lectin/glucanases superfamily n=1 Tax=Corchorus olitorius TaxID=93759 RepID=A0A1R3HCX7_9ROSI|nr:Concanavalin A-like lectin/glucanases superfamily [Corchorus olitorius]